MKPNLRLMTNVTVRAFVGIGFKDDSGVIAFVHPAQGKWSVTTFETKYEQKAEELSQYADEELGGYENLVRSNATKAHPTETLPTAPAQYLFAVGDSPFALWTLTDSGWFDAGGVHYESPLDRKPYTTWQRVVRGAK